MNAAWLLPALLLTGSRPAPILPRAVEEFGARGPMVLCEAGLALGVGGNEAVLVRDGALRVMADDSLLAIVRSDQGDAGTFSSRDAAGVIWRRFTGPVAGAPVFAELGPDKVRYRLVLAGAGESIIVGSPAFDGSARDQAVLARFGAAGGGCVPALRFSSEDPAYQAAGFARYPDSVPLALYPPQPELGPTYVCLGGIGFPLRDGERLLRPWRSLGAGVSWLTLSEVTVRIEGGNPALRPADPQDVREHPLGQMHHSRITFYPSRGVGPPYAPVGVREDGSWVVEAGVEQGRGMKFTFPAGDKAPVGFGFLERLDMVTQQDARCSSAAGRKGIEQ